MQEEAYYNALNIAARSNYHAILKLKERHASWERAWHAFQKTQQSDVDPAEAYRALVARGIFLALREDPRYPRLLAEIPFAPFGIYCEGILPNEPAISVVGTRKATDDGTETAYCFGRAFAEHGIPVVSGLALGIDAAAHRGALAGDGPTIAVLANGLDRYYPHTNGKLAKDIIARRGGVVSEYPLGAPPLPHRFLERNRIVSGMAKGVVIIEAPQRSGSLATARFALEQNREVFVVPGPARHPNFFGSHLLIRDGAGLVTNPENVLEALSFPLRKTSEDTASDPEELAVIAALETARRPLAVDKIIEITSLNAQTASRILSLLVLRNRATETERGFILTE